MVDEVNCDGFAKSPDAALRCIQDEASPARKHAANKLLDNTTKCAPHGCWSGGCPS